MKTSRRDLERRRNALASAIASGIDATRDPDQRRDLFKDPYGSASLTHDDEIAAAVVDRRARELDAATRALEALDAGRYGVCQDCGQPIPAARLRVLPFATRCVGCQASSEGLRRAA